jgi:hypothetical protein
MMPAAASATRIKNPRSWRMNFLPADDQWEKGDGAAVSSSINSSIRETMIAY